MTAAPSQADVEDAILNALVVDVALHRAALVESVVGEWYFFAPPNADQAPPNASVVDVAIRRLQERGWLYERRERYDGEEFDLVSLTDAGKAEWRRRNPLEERLESASFSQGAGDHAIIYAPSEEIADRIARDEYGTPFGFEVDLNVKKVEPSTYTLEGTGDVIAGVRVEHTKIRRLPRVLTTLWLSPLLLRLWIASRRARREASADDARESG